tara:strand:- start:474 stop:662 length:189 start_codon:yes stop_codon:yes gene_type:complete
MIIELKPKYNMEQVDILGRLFAILDVAEDRGLTITAVDNKGEEITEQSVMDGMLPSTKEVLI